MQPKLFLTGPSGCGKTTMIRNALGSAFSCAGGFITERAVDENGSLAGFDLLPAGAASGLPGFTALRFLDCTCTPPKADTEVFRKEAVRLLSEAEYYPFSVIDEFGGFELLIPEFRAALSDFLSSPCPCIGVFKDADNVENLRRTLGLTDRFLTCRQQILNAIENFDDILIVKTTGRYDDAAVCAVSEWCREYAE